MMNNFRLTDNRLSDSACKIQETIFSLEFIFALTAFVGVLTLKLWYQTAEVVDLLWILYPTSKLVSLFSGESFLFINGQGFMRADSLVLINKGCSGINFLAISVSLAVYTSLHIKIAPFKKTIILVQSVFVAYCITIAANTSRILGAMSLAPVQDIFSSSKIADKLHMAEGMFVYLFFLIFLFFLLKGGIYARNP